MEQKRIFGLIFLVLAMTVVVQGVVAATAEYAYLAEVSKTNFIPASIHAGDSIGLSVDITNRALSALMEDLNVTLELSDQFEGIKLTDAVNFINPGSTKTFLFRFKAKNDLQPGFYTVVLRMDYKKNGQDAQQTYNISVPVSKTEKNIDVTITPTSINPGNQTQITFTLKNLGGTSISNIAFSWSEASNLVLPLGSDNKKYIDEIDAGKSAEISYNVAADPNITPGIYPLDIGITFNDSNGTRTQTSQVGFIIGGKTEFDVSAEVLSSNQVSLSIANIGSNNAGGVIVKIPQQQGVAVTGSNTSIIGNINKGDFTLANFQINFLQQGTGQGNVQEARQGTLDNNAGQQRRFFGAGPIPLTVEIDYTDTTGERQKIEKTVQLNSGSFSTGASADGQTTTQTSQGGALNPTQSGFARRSQQNSWIIPLAAFVVIASLTAFVNTRIKPQKKDWKNVAMALIPVVLMFAATIFLLNSDLFAAGISTIISAIIIIWFYGIGNISGMLSKSSK
jgi:hypothetical protein